MKCPVCNNKTKVIGSRSVSPSRKRRTRECAECLTRFKTIELMDYSSLSDYILMKMARKASEEEK